MIIKDRILGDINNGVQDIVVEAVVDAESDLPAQDALGSSFKIVSPSRCHCINESTDWEMNSLGQWKKQDTGMSVTIESASFDVDLSDYYTADETDTAISTALDDYYTKLEVDALIPDMTLYYTSSETDSAITTALGNYYTKSQVDNLLPDMTLYYTSSQTDSAISSYWTTNIANYYTKSEVDALIPTVPSTYDADDIVYDNSTSGLTATDVQDAIDEVVSSIPTIPSTYDADDIVYDNTTSGLTATDVQDAIDEVVASIPTVPSTYDADDIVYDNTTSGLTATDVQNAIDEVVASIPTIPATYDADDVTYDNTTSGLTASNVQDAIDELAQGGGGGGSESFIEVGKNKICPFVKAEFGSNASYKTSISYDTSDGSEFIQRKSVNSSYNGGKDLLQITLKPSTNYIFSGAEHASSSTYYLDIFEVTATGTTNHLVRVNSSTETTITTGTTGVIIVQINFPTPSSTFTYREYWMIREQGESSTFEQYTISGGTFISGGSAYNTPNSLNAFAQPGIFWSQDGWWRFTSSGNGDQVDFVMVCEQGFCFIDQKIMCSVKSTSGNVVSGKYYYRRLNQQDGTWSVIQSA